MLAAIDIAVDDVEAARVLRIHDANGDRRLDRLEFERLLWELTTPSRGATGFDAREKLARAVMPSKVPMQSSARRGSAFGHVQADAHARGHAHLHDRRGRFTGSAVRGRWMCLRVGPW